MKEHRMKRHAIPIESPGTDDAASISGPSPFPIHGALAFSPAERLVLDTLEGAPSLTAGQLRAQTGLTQEEIAATLDSLRAKGVVACLNTVVESFRSRFPGVSLDAE
jgi:MarR family